MGAVSSEIVHRTESLADREPRTPEPRAPSLLNYIHSAIAIPLIYLYTIVMGSLSLLVSLRDPCGRKQHWCAQRWSRMIARTVGAKSTFTALRRSSAVAPTSSSRRTKVTWTSL